jgi:hypothetical protein
LTSLSDSTFDKESGSTPLELCSADVVAAPPSTAEACCVSEIPSSKGIAAELPRARPIRMVLKRRPTGIMTNATNST